MPVTRFDPGLFQAGWYWEKTPDSSIMCNGDGSVPGARHDYRPSGEKLGPKRENVKRTAITASKMNAKPLPGHLSITGDVDRDAFDARQDWILLALMFGAVDDPVELETGCFLHRFHGSASDLVFPQTIGWLLDRNDGMIQRLRQSMLSKLAITIPTSGLIQVKPSFVGRAYDYWGDVTLQAGGAGTALPMIRGLSDAAYLQEPVFAKVISSTSTTVSVKIKRGGPTSYGSAVQVFNKGAWTWAMDEAGAPIGDRSLKTEILFPATGTYVVNDEYQFAPNIASWSPTYVDNAPSNSIFASVSKGGVEIEVDSATLNFDNPAMAKFGVGGAFAKRSRARGKRGITCGLSREYQEENFKRDLEMLGSFRIDIGIHSGVTIGTTGRYDCGIDIVFPAVSLSGDEASAESETKMDEQVTAEPYSPSGDPDLPDDCYVYLYSDTPSLAVA